MSRLKIWPVLTIVALVGVFLFIQDASFTSSNFKRAAITKSSSHKQKTTFFAAKSTEDSTDDENNAKDDKNNEEITKASDNDEDTKSVVTKDNDASEVKKVASDEDDATNSNENTKVKGNDNDDANDNTKVKADDAEDDNNTNDNTNDDVLDNAKGNSKVSSNDDTDETNNEENSKKVSTESSEEDSTENTKVTSTENTKEASSENDNDKDSDDANDEANARANDNEDNAGDSDSVNEDTTANKSNDSGESSKTTEDSSENANVEKGNESNNGNDETKNAADVETLNAGNSTSTDNSTTNSSNSSNSSNGSISFSSSTTNGTTWLSRVEFPSGFYACGAQVQIATYSTFEYMTGLAFIICNGSDWTTQALSVVVEAVNSNGSAGPWEDLKSCPTGSYVTGESVLIEKLGTALVYIGLRLECDDENRTWVDVYAQTNESDVTEGRWEQDVWTAMAIEAVQLGYYDVDGHVAINRIKNILRKKNITNAYLNYSSDEQVWDRREFVVQKNDITNNGQGVMEFSETYNPYERAEEIFRMDNGGNFTLSFSTNFKFAVPELTSNGSDIVIVETKSMEFGKKQEKVENGRSYEISYELPNCTSGELIEYGSITDLKIPFELDIYYNYGETQKLTGTYEKTLYMRGSLNFTQVSNDTCTKVEEEKEKSKKGKK